MYVDIVVDEHCRVNSMWSNICSWWTLSSLAQKTSACPLDKLSFDNHIIIYRGFMVFNATEQYFSYIMAIIIIYKSRDCQQTDHCIQHIWSRRLKMCFSLILTLAIFIWWQCAFCLTHTYFILINYPLINRTRPVIL
jgi:hypothetical protein